MQMHCEDLPAEHYCYIGNVPTQVQTGLGLSQSLHLPAVRTPSCPSAQAIR